MQVHCTCHQRLHIELLMQTSIMLCSPSSAQCSHVHCLASAALHAGLLCCCMAYVISACSIKHNSANAPYLPWWAAHCNADADQHRVVFPCKCTVQPCTLLDQCCFACCSVVAYVISACSIKHNSASTPHLPSETAY